MTDMPSPRPARRSRIGGACACALLVVGLFPLSPAAEADEAGSGPTRISVLSSLPDTISGGDALIKVTPPDDGTPLADIAVMVGGRDQSDELEIDEDARTLTGVVTDIPVGGSEIRAIPAGGGPPTVLSVTGHPQEGPVIAGPHEQPFVCETEDAVQPVIGDTLGAPIDENCSIEDRVDYFYQNTSSDYMPWPEGATTYPDDVRLFDGPSGEQTPMIVRMETGTVNRAIYRTTVLHDPLSEDDPTPTAPPASWNGSAMFTFGGGCPGGWYRQGASTGDVTANFMLTQGFALMTSSLNVFGSNCNDLLAAETAMMVREEFSESYGAPENVIAWGSSGGSYQSLQIADNYPGILDGLIISDTFPEVGFATTNYITDAKLLQNYFSTTDTEWSEEQRVAVAGLNSYEIVTHVAGDSRTNPRANCDHLPKELRYDPETNPGGARCDVFSHTKNAYGTDPETGLPRRPMDNVGVQYGLAALEDGTITVDQFLDLNESIGGFDGDSTMVPERTSGDVEAIRAAYQTGRLTSGGGGLASVPIIDHRTYLDEKENGDIHVRYHSLSLRQRLIDANGTSANLASVMRDGTHPAFGQHAITAMDQWLRAIDADTSDSAPIDKIAANRPPQLQDGCYLRDDDSNTFRVEPLDRDPDSVCEQQYPSGSFPREVAGDTIAASVAKCQVAPPDRAAYPADLDDAQWERLQEVFADGVCDYTVPGVEQQGLADTWLQFDGDGWAPLNLANTPWARRE